MTTRPAATVEPYALARARHADVTAWARRSRLPGLSFEEFLAERAAILADLAADLARGSAAFRAGTLARLEHETARALALLA